MERALERTEICQLYLEFLALSLKTYVFASDLINTEVERFTKGELREGWIFFLLIFSHGLMLNKVNNLEALEQYIENPGQINMKLTKKGEELYDYLNQKIDLHASILKFNGIAFYDLIADINGMSRMMKFWKILLKPSNN